MARRVFFSFHFEHDIWRANQVRNCWVTKPNTEDAGFIDAVDWESIESQGKQAVEEWIDNQLVGTSVTVVLIGYETSSRYYVNYEIVQSIEKGNGFLGVRIHNLKDQDGQTDFQGNNPLDNFSIDVNGHASPLSLVYPTYDWLLDNGYNNIGDWVEDVAQIAGR
ncbi:MAG: TIR domain-containing protein [Bacteroidetes bacterium]|nr:TIR domain-containing protein [Bacteroidota bacterium]